MVYAPFDLSIFANREVCFGALRKDASFPASLTIKRHSGSSLAKGHRDCPRQRIFVSNEEPCITFSLSDSATKHREHAGNEDCSWPHPDL